MAKQAPPQPMTAPSFPSPGTSGPAQMPGKAGIKSTSNGNTMGAGHRTEAFARGVVSKQSHAPAPHREKKMRGGNY